MADVLRFETEGPVALITLNRPEQLNALNDDLRGAYVEALQRVRQDDGIRVAVVAGAGRAFCAGADLKARAAADRGGSDNFFAAPNEGSLHSQVVEKPMIAAIHGYCLGGGLELAMTCDLRVASETAKFGLPEIRRGFFPGGGGPQRLPRLVPQALAMEMLLTGDHYDAGEMLRWGLLNRVVAEDRLLGEATSLAGRIAAHAPLAVRAMKELAYTSADMPLSQALRYGAGLRWIIGQTEDAKEGPRAFAEKRQPEYRGR